MTEQRYLQGGKRCAIEKSEWLEGWWIGISPRNGEGADVEGPWEDWVILAQKILEMDSLNRAESQGEDEG